MTQHQRWTAVLLGVLTMGVLTAAAHTPFLMVETGAPGNIRIETGFSDGGTGAGMEVVLKEKATGRTLSVHTMPENGVLEVPMPETPYTVSFDSGPGHVITKDGPLTEDTSEAPATSGRVYLVGTGVGNPAWLTVEAVNVIGRADMILCYQRVADRLAPLLEAHDPIIMPDDVWPAFGIGGTLEEQSPENLDRFRRASEIRQAAEQAVRAVYSQGQTAVVLAGGQFESAPDWAWLSRALHDLNPEHIPGALPPKTKGHE